MERMARKEISLINLESWSEQGANGVWVDRCELWETGSKTKYITQYNFPSLDLIADIIWVSINDPPGSG